MPVEMKVPSFGESITEALVARWLKNEGDRVEQDELVVVLETDKVTSEVPAPVAGVLRRILQPVGATVSIGAPLAVFDEAASAASPAPAAPAPAQTRPDRAPAPQPAASTGAPRVMPSAARVLAQAGVDPGQVTPSGPGGRILKEDAQRAVAAREAAPPQAAATARPLPGSAASVPAAQRPVPPALVAAAVPNDGTRQEELVPMTPLRKKIAERLVRAQQTAALLTTFNEVDMSAVMELRQQHKESFESRYGVKLGFMSFFVKAVIDALKLVPQVNAEVQGDAVLYRNFYDIGVAVGGGRGLVVPVLRDVDRMSFAEVERAIAEYARKAKENKLSLEDLSGGTFTISNGGIYGSMLSTPIVNTPQSGILGLHAIQDRPVARNGQVVIRPMMYVALTYDHRIIDGREAVTFLKRIKECIENPTRILLEV